MVLPPFSTYNCENEVENMVAKGSEVSYKVLHKISNSHQFGLVGIFARFFPLNGVIVSANSSYDPLHVCGH